MIHPFENFLFFFCFFFCWASVPLDVIEKSKDKIAETFFHHSRSKSFDRGYQDGEERKDEDQIITPQQASRRQQKRRPGRRQEPTHERNSYKSNQRRKNKPFVEPHYGSDSPVWKSNEQTSFHGGNSNFFIFFSFFGFFE